MMNIPLQEFEQYIDETILNRGYKYFKKGLVAEPEQIAHGEYEAIVEGTDDYTVRIRIENDTITEHSCTCPYDMGPVCKHVAAVIFELQQNELSLVKKAKKSSTTAKTVAKKKTIAEQVDEILEHLTSDDMKEILRGQCDRDRKFRQLFLAGYAHLVMPETKALYVKQVKAILKSSSDRHGFIDYSGARAVGIAIDEYIQTAGKHLEKANYKSAMLIAFAVMEEMTGALQYADDSNGDVGGSIYSAIEILYSVANAQVSEKLRVELLNYCLTAYSKGLYKGWDWHFTMLDLASRLVNNTSEAKQIHQQLDSIKSSGKSWDWEFTNAQQIRALLIRRTEGEEKATQYLEQNLSNAEFRKEVIEKAISAKDYRKAMALAEEGIKLNSKESPGLLDYWCDYLLQIAQLQNDRENILKYARIQLISANRDKKPYFDILRKHIEPHQWEATLKMIIQDILSKNRWNGNSLVAMIYIWEENWNELLRIVKSDISLNTLDTYEKYLVKDFSDEISDMYQKAVLKYLEKNVSRDHYQIACRYIRRMIKMGAREKADYVVQMLRKLYPQRRALMEELKKV